MKGLLSVLFFFLLASKTYSWWSAGHMLTAQIAKFELISKDIEAFHYFDSLVKNLNSLTDGRSNNFVEAASWPDDIKVPGFEFWNPWHYIDRIYNPDGENDSKAIQDYQNNILFALQNVNKTLSRKEELKMEKSVMARFLIHLLGDIHQPLHSTSLVNEQFLSGDMGGNLFMIDFKNITTNFHSFWDSGAFVWTEWERPLNESSLNELESFARNLTNKFERKTLEKELEIKNFTSWTIDSFHQAVDGYKQLMESQNHTVTESYLTQAYSTMERNLVLGGYRLADLISEFYKVDQKNKNESGSKFLGIYQ